ncbi:O-methyltransferase 3 [Nitritalea halalkaliphila LW7]|uniref:O-methyltransferase 3 n=1 Tax=Nitritalea halalkaliphila LW7 TaxID=1189621 RepID=I5C0S4_9BACT|nr:O-methyltransferase [Nitritalea halalkaliphila]EIM75426.1 O-methyltransferase 3 [Nitritalea halalkaliphila LW7]
MEFIDEKLQAYCEAHTSPEDPILAHITRETHLKVLMPRMLSGNLQGKFLEMLTRFIRPKRVVEIGTYTGYSAICMARGLEGDAILHTLDINVELETMVRGFFEKAGLSDKIDYRLGDAQELIPALPDGIDMVFIDADKENYGRYYDLIFDKLAPGAVILADNVLWSGKILHEGPKKPDKDTAALIAFNRMVQEDPRVDNILLPIRDGILVARKK